MPRTLHVLSLSLALLLAACNSEAPPPQAEKAAPAAAAQPAAPSADEQFADLSKRWLDGSFKLSPVSATQIGDHRFDGDLDDLSADGRQRGLDFSKGMLAELDKIDRAKLSRENQVDYGMLKNQLRSDIWSTETLQGWAWDPTIYSQIAGGALYTLMAREFAPMPDRLRSATARMEKLPKLFEQMHANLDLARVPKIHAETVSKQNKGVLSLVDGLIMPHAGELPRRGQAETRRGRRRAAQGRRREPDLARQDAGAEREGRFPHRRETVRREARVRAELAAVAPGNPQACRSGARKHAHRDVRHRADRFWPASRRRRRCRRIRAKIRSSRRSRPRSSSRTPIGPRATR